MQIFSEQSFIAQDNGHDDKLLAIRHDTPLLFPISSKRDVSRRISINRRRRTIKRKGERAKRSAPGAFVHALHLWILRICMRLRKGSDGSFLHSMVLHSVSVGHLGPAGVDGGRVPITQHSRAPTFVSTSTCVHHLYPASSLYLCAARMQQPPERRQSAGGRTNDRLPTCASTRIRSYYVIFRHRFFVGPTRARRYRHTLQR